MKTDDYYQEHIHQIWNEDGWRHEVGTDPDGLGQIELRYIEEGRCLQRICFDPNIAEELCAAIMEEARRQRLTTTRPVLPGHVRVRIAVATAISAQGNGIYCAAGWKDDSGDQPDCLKESAARLAGKECRISFVEADVPLPEAPMKILGVLENGT